MRVGGKGAHLILELREHPEVVHPALLVECCNRICASDLPSGGTHGREGRVWLDDPQRGLDHLAAIVHLGYDPIGPVRAVNRNRCFGPFRGLIATRGIGEHPTSSAGIFAGDNNAGFISPLSRARRWIDGDHHSYQRRSCADAQSFQHAAVPEGTWNIFEELSFELLAAERSPLLFPNYLSEEGRGA